MMPSGQFWFQQLCISKSECFSKNGSRIFVCARERIVHVRPHHFAINLVLVNETFKVWQARIKFENLVHPRSRQSRCHDRPVAHICAQTMFSAKGRLKGHGCAIIAKSTPFQAPASMRTALPLPPSSAGVPMTESCTRQKAQSYSELAIKLEA